MKHIHIEGCPFYIGGAQFEYWQHTHLIIDVVPGRGAGFSVETPRGFRFLKRRGERGRTKSARQPVKALTNAREA